PIKETFGAEGASLTKPSPREISERLLARREFVPVPHLNLLVSGWLQFMVHDWLSHGPSLREDPHRIPLENGDDWYENPMTILRTSPDAAGPQDQGQPVIHVSSGSSFPHAGRGRTYGASGNSGCPRQG